MVSVSPDTVAFIVTAVIWFIGAIFLILVVHPWRLSVRLKRDGLTKTAIVRSVHHNVVAPMISKLRDELQVQRGYIEENISEITLEIDSKIEAIEIPSFPGSIPSMGEIKQLVEDGRQKTNGNLDQLQRAIPGLIIATLETQEFETLLKQYEGRMYRAKGIDIEDHQKGLEAAEQVYLEKIERDDPNDRSELKLILKDALQVAADAGYIDPDSVSQKIGMVEGILRIVDRVKKIGSGGSAGTGSTGLKAPR